MARGKRKANAVTAKRKNPRRTTPSSPTSVDETQNAENAVSNEVNEIEVSNNEENEIEVSNNDENDIEFSNKNEDFVEERAGEVYTIEEEGEEEVQVKREEEDDKGEEKEEDEQEDDDDDENEKKEEEEGVKLKREEEDKKGEEEQESNDDDEEEEEEEDDDDDEEEEEEEEEEEQEQEDEEDAVEGDEIVEEEKQEEAIGERVEEEEEREEEKQEEAAIQDEEQAVKGVQKEDGKNEENAGDEEKNGDNKGKSEETNEEKKQINEIKAMEENHIAEENIGIGADKNEAREHLGGEQKLEEHLKEQLKGKAVENSKRKIINSRKRIRKEKIARGPAGKLAPDNGNRGESSHIEKAKKGEDDAEKEATIHEAHSNKKNSVDVNKDEKQEICHPQDGGGKVKEDSDKKVGESSKKAVQKLKRRRRRNNVAERASEKVASIGEDKAEASNRLDVSIKAETKGMIFMCSSKTKKDCYHYKVFGLPAGKKNIVEKIYKGMKLFLYDVDLKLLYGVYKAAERGGYNIEPKAFNSQFPAQVRFKIFEDCLPLAEEKFRTVIKDNYYTRTKFDCQLNLKQVNNLCKLFVRSGKISQSKRLGTKKKLARERIRGRDKVRQPPLRDEGRHHERPRARVSPVAPLPRISALPLLRPASSYAYESTLDREAYRREPPVERHESYMQGRLLDPQGSYRRDPLLERHNIYRQELLEQRGYHEGAPMLEHRDSYMRDALSEHRDSHRRNARLEHHDPYRRELVLENRDPYRREPLLEHRDSYRRELLVEYRDPSRREPLLLHRDLNGQDVRLEHRRLNLEPMHHHERERRDLHFLYREQPSHSERVYSPGLSAEYHSRVVMPAEPRPVGLSTVYIATTGPPPDRHHRY